MGTQKRTEAIMVQRDSQISTKRSEGVTGLTGRLSLGKSAAQ